MDNKQILDLSHAITNAIINDMNAMVKKYIDMHSAEDTMAALGPALGTAAGHILSTICCELDDPKERDAYMQHFFGVINEAAEQHHQRHIAKQN